MPDFGDEGDVYVTLPSDGDVHVARDQLHIDTEIVREVATEYNLDADSLHDALARVQSYGECISLPAIEAVATATIVAADERGATYVLADAEPCWRAEADRLNLSNAGLDAIVEAHRRETVATVGQIPDDTVAFVLDCPDIPVRAVQRLRTLRRQTHLENRDALVLALEDEGLKPKDIGTILGLTSGAVAAISQRTESIVDRARNTVALVDLPGVLRYSNFDPMHDEWLGLDWSDWRSLDRTNEELGDLSTEAGFYRVRHPNFEPLVYIGETGAEDGLRGRVRSGLAVGIADQTMPTQSRTSHDGARRLWAIRDEYGPGLQVSVATPAIAADRRHRKGMEAALLAIHRREHDCSPLANFGRVISGYRLSKSTSGQPGGRVAKERAPVPERSLSPPPWNHWRAVRSDDWLGLEWTRPRSLQQRTEIDDVEGCVYRLWNEDRSDDNETSNLTYIGVTRTPMSHLFSLEQEYGRDVSISLSEIDEIKDEEEHRRRRRELKTDLVGCHYLAIGESPVDQF